jgi:DNA mismatch endonuclease (patch repair protein)
MSRSTPEPSSDAAHKRMKAAKPRDTLPEMRLRAALDSLGVKYEVDEKPIKTLNRKADILIKDKSIVIFVDGCFWHGCPIHGTQSKNNSEFWIAKISRNQERDKDTDQKLIEFGWKVVRVWEHQDPDDAAMMILSLIKGNNNQK